MEVITTVAGMRERALERRREGKSIGLVPTMGYFHEGHASLMRESAANNDCTIVTLFVNPAQFGPDEDLHKYPRDFDRDRLIAEGAGADFLFMPDMGEMYPEGYKTYIWVEDWSGKLCGVTRPVHFRGVTTICCKLFNICAPDRAYFGLKDAQQCLIIKKMVADLNMDLEVVPMPTVREADGLAMSSRNVYLKPEERRDALRISEALFMAKTRVEAGERDAEGIKDAVRAHIYTSPLAKIDYVEAVDTDTLEDAREIKPGVLLAAAVFFGSTRLIDNIIL